MLSKRALKGLKGSIKKWEKIVGGTGRDKGTFNCPLCFLYIENNCKSCPVYKKTQESSCRKSPYIKWVHHQNKKHDKETFRQVHCSKCKSLAQKELDFLKSLLPK